MFIAVHSLQPVTDSYGKQHRLADAGGKTACNRYRQELTAQAPDYAEFQRNLQQVNKDLAALDNS